MWKRIKFAFKEIWGGAKIGLLFGFAIGFISYKLRADDLQETFMAIVMYHMRLGVFFGASCGAVLKGVRVFRARKEAMILSQEGDNDPNSL